MNTPTPRPALAPVRATGESAPGLFPFEIDPESGRAHERAFRHRSPFWVLYGPENILRPGRFVLRLWFGDRDPAVLTNPFLTASSRHEAELALLSGRYRFVPPSPEDPPGLLGCYVPLGDDAGAAPAALPPAS